jgi:hypothetical protein
MKNILTLLIVLSAFIGNAQRTMFHAQNKRVAPTAAAPTAVAPTPNGSLITDGLVLNLDAGDLSSYSGTGTSWTDLSGNGNHGTLENNVTYNSSNQGYFVFNGNGSYAGSGGFNPYVSLPISTDFDFGTANFTVELWALTTSANPHPEFITLNVNGASYAGFRMEYWNGNVNMLHSYDGVSHANGGSFSIILNTWQHIVVSRISGTVSVYVNGVLKTTYSLPGSLLAQQNSRIGDFYGSNGYYSFSGNIALVKIFKNKGLTAIEAEDHFTLTKSRFGL